MSIIVNRSAGLDGMKFVAALCVIALHVGSYSPMAGYLEDSIRLLSRWAVPFFFLITGYFMGDRTGENLRDWCVMRLCAVTRVFIFASIILAPLAFMKMGALGAVSYFVSADVFLRGSYFHLWFLGSMITAFLLIIFFNEMRCIVLMNVAAVIVLLLYLVLGAWNPVSQEGLDVAQQLSGFGFVVLGRHLSKYCLGIRGGLLLAVLGITVMFVEAELVEQFVGNDPYNIRFSFGILISSVGLFYLAHHSKFPKLMARVGENDSLTIYILHPYFIFLCAPLLTHYYNGWAAKLWLVLLVFGMTLICSLVMRKYFPILAPFNTTLLIPIRLKSPISQPCSMTLWPTVTPCPTNSGTP